MESNDTPDQPADTNFGDKTSVDAALESVIAKVASRNRRLVRFGTGSSVIAIIGVIAALVGFNTSPSNLSSSAVATSPNIAARDASPTNPTGKANSPLGMPNIAETSPYMRVTSQGISLSLVLPYQTYVGGCRVPYPAPVLGAPSGTGPASPGKVSPESPSPTAVAGTASGTVNSGSSIEPMPPVSALAATSSQVTSSTTVTVMRCEEPMLAIGGEMTLTAVAPDGTTAKFLATFDNVSYESSSAPATVVTEGIFWEKDSSGILVVAIRENSNVSDFALIGPTGQIIDHAAAPNGWVILAGVLVAKTSKPCSIPNGYSVSATPVTGTGTSIFALAGDQVSQNQECAQLAISSLGPMAAFPNGSSSTTQTTPPSTTSGPVPTYSAG